MNDIEKIHAKQDSDGNDITYESVSIANPLGEGNISMKFLSDVCSRDSDTHPSAEYLVKAFGRNEDETKYCCFLYQNDVVLAISIGE